MLEALAPIFLFTGPWQPGRGIELANDVAAPSQISAQFPRKNQFYPLKAVRKPLETEVPFVENDGTSCAKKAVAPHFYAGVRYNSFLYAGLVPNPDKNTCQLGQCHHATTRQLLQLWAILLLPHHATN